MPSIALSTLFLILINVVVTFKGFGDARFFDRYKFQVGAIKARQWDRMLTSGFLHVDNRHLLFNMITLFFFADVVITGFGEQKFLLIYAISLFTGSLLALSFHQNEPFYSAVGASGAVTGILYSAILLQPDMRLALYFIPIPIPAYVLGILYLLYSIYGMKTRVGNIGHTAHFGGAIGGYVTTLILLPQLIETDTFIVGVLAVPIVLMFILERLGKL